MNLKSLITLKDQSIFSKYLANTSIKVSEDSVYRQTLAQRGLNTPKNLIGNLPSKSTWNCLKQS